jgi:hypothetical protein
MQPTGQPTSQPTMQPTGVPTNQPTSFPTTPLQVTISFNVTQQLHEVNLALFTESLDECSVAMGGTVTDLLNLFPEEGFVMRGVAEYHNQIYDSPETAPGAYDGINSRPASRRLGMTHGSRGIVVTYTVNVVPQALGYADSDSAFEGVKAKLVKAVTRHVFTDVARNQAMIWGCDALLVIEGATITHVSSDYLSTVTHSSYPTSSPTIVPRVRKQKNRTGVIAGVLVGVTVFIAAVMVAMYNKGSFGMQPHPDVIADQTPK